jgi:hypothetical protein
MRAKGRGRVLAPAQTTAVSAGVNLMTRKNNAYSAHKCEYACTRVLVHGCKRVIAFVQAHCSQLTSTCLRRRPLRRSICIAHMTAAQRIEIKIVEISRSKKVISIKVIGVTLEACRTVAIGSDLAARTQETGRPYTRGHKMQSIVTAVERVGARTMQPSKRSLELPPKL